MIYKQQKWNVILYPVYWPRTAYYSSLSLSPNSTILRFYNNNNVNNNNATIYNFHYQPTGFYRVTYDDNNWIALIKQLNEDPNAIHVLNRIQLIYEIFNLVSDRKLNYSVPMQLLKYFEKENSVTPWYIARRYFDRKMMSMRNSEEYYIFKVSETFMI